MFSLRNKKNIFELSSIPLLSGALIHHILLKHLYVCLYDCLPSSCSILICVISYIFSRKLPLYKVVWHRNQLMMCTSVLGSLVPCRQIITSLAVYR